MPLVLYLHLMSEVIKVHSSRFLMKAIKFKYHSHKLLSATF